MPKHDKTPEIPCFTIPVLADMGDRQGTPVSGPLFRNFLIAKTDSKMEAFQFPCRIGAITIGICTAGESRILSNLREYTLTEGSMFVSTPQNILQVYSEHDFRCDVLAISPDFMRQIHINTQYLLPVLMGFGDQQCFPLSEANRSALHHLILQIETEMQVASGTHFTTEIISELISATIYKIGDILTRRIEQCPPQEQPRRNRAETYFRQFMQLLSESFKTERSVAYYARRMCITPKYLTTLIKRISNKSVSEWIDEYVILEAKTLLKYSNMSIQEIAYHLNFPNQSFFGSYFKRNTGLSPSQYKQS